MANAAIFRNMALANPVAAMGRSSALRGPSYAKPIVRRMTEKESLVRQSLYVPDGEVPRKMRSTSGIRDYRGNLALVTRGRG